jgi:O-antigen/teichoic acid export membrane protein
MLPVIRRSKPNPVQGRPRNMGRLKTVLQNTGVLTFAKILRPFLSILLIRTISQLMGPEGQGDYTTIFSYILLFEIISAFGMKTLLVREIAQNKELGQKYYLHSIGVAFPMSVFSMIAMWGLVLLLGFEIHMMHAALFLAVSLIATGLNECSEGILIGYEKIQMIGIIWAIENVLRVLISVLLIKNGHGLFALVIVYVALRYAILIFFTVYVFIFLGRPKLRLEKSFYFQLIRTARIFFIITIFVTLYWKTDILLLHKLKGNYDVGIYDGAYRFFGIIIVVISQFVLSLFPVISEYFKSNKQVFAAVCKKTLKYFLILVFPCVTILMFASGPLVLLIFGEEYKASIPILRILTLIIIPYGIKEIFAHMLIASDNQKIDMMINGIGVCFNVILNLLLIPKYSYLGSAIALLTSMVLFLVIQFVFISKRVLDIHLRELFRFLAVMVLSLGIMILFIFGFKFMGIIPAAILSCVLYFICVWFFKLISKNDKELILSLVKNIKLH